MRGPGRIRRAVQSGITLAFLAAPWVSFGNLRLIGFDRTGGLQLFGAQVSASGLFPYLVLLLSLLFLTLFAAASLGRLWCGWLCPQSVLSDFAFRAGRVWGGVCFSFVAALSLALYFLPPAEFFSTLAAGRPGYAHFFALGTWVFLFADMVWVGRRFCRTTCPYGKILGLLADREMVAVRFDGGRGNFCKGCDRCVRVCPMGLDVRREAGPECIACGRCIDACAAVFAKSPEKPLIGFVLPEGGFFRGVLLHPRNFALLLAALVGLGFFAATLGSRSGVNFAVRLSPQTPPRTLADGRLAVFFTAHLSGRAGVYALSARSASGEAEDLRGEVAGLILGGGDSREARFALVVSSGGGGRVDFILRDASGGEVAAATLDTSAALKGLR